MSDCNSIESLLNQLLSKLDNDSNCCDQVFPRLGDAEKAIFRLQDGIRNHRQRLEILEAFYIDAKKKDVTDRTIPARLKRAELQIKSQISFTAKLDTRLKKLDNDFRYAVKKFRKEIDDLQKQIFAIVGVGGLLFLLGEKLDKLVHSVDVVKDGLKALDKGLDALGKSFKVLEEGLKTIGKVVDLIKKFIDNPKNKGEKGDRGDRGLKGDKGDQGIRGLQGNTGGKGNQGNTGSKGDKGQTGEKGDRGLKGDKGDKGDRGLTGQTGEKGDRGEAGQTGAKGDQGLNGEAGAKGDQGLNGEAGAKGDQGLTGQTGAKGDQGDKGEEGQVTIVETEVTKLVYEKPDLTEVLAKILELRQRLIFNSTVEISTDCGVDPVAVNTTDLPSFLNAIEDKLSGLEDLICQNPELEPYQLGSFTEPATVNLEKGTKFIKVNVTKIPVGISNRFGRSISQPSNYPFGFVAFESKFGLYPESNWEWIDSYFYPDKEMNATKFHVYSNYPNINYSITGFKVKP
jgi:hypothetical protein